MEKTFRAIETFFKEHRKLTPETVRSYRIALTQCFTFCQKEHDEIETGDIKAWLTDLHERGLKPRSLRLKLAALKSFYQYCMEDELLAKAPGLKIELPKIPESPPAHLNRASLARLLELATGHPRNRALVAALYDTGARINELLDVKLEYVDFKSGEIKIVRGKGGKGRFVLFTTECSERLQEYLAGRKVQSEYLFCNYRGGRLSQSWVEKVFRGYTKTLSLGQKVTPHTMRHTFAYHLAEKGMPQSYLQALLGHKRIGSTGIYTKPSEAERKIKYDSFQ
jgi:site-specific recombinase XerD